ncbi:MAG: hypothetical protein ACE5JX_06880 [Acidobacteriota bacterium]
MAYQKMGSALSSLSLVTVVNNEYGVPFLYQREAYFRSAASQLAEAEAYLSKLEH